MATGSSKNPSTMSTTGESLSCPLCLEVFRNPKILPCFHTFCQSCLNDLVNNHPHGKFPCPFCRQEIQVPSGGASGFSNNFYIKPEDLEKARNTNFCTKHPNKEMEVYCVQCETLICVTCLVTKHKQHEAEDISEATNRLKTQLRKDKPRLDDCVQKVKKNTDDAKKELQELKAKKAAVQEAINNRHATLQKAIDKYRDDALASLNKLTDAIEADLTSDPDCHEHSVEELTKLQQRVQQAVDSEGALSELLAVAREMRCGRGSEQAVQELTTKQMTTVCRPVLYYTSTPDKTFEMLRNYMGRAATMKMSVSAPEVSVVEQFRCREDPDTDIYHVCPWTDGKVWVSYEPDILSSGVMAEMFDADGKVVGAIKPNIPGRIPAVRRKDGNYMYMDPELDITHYYAKKCESTMLKFFKLVNILHGEVNINTEEIVSEDPLNVTQETLFSIKCGANRSFDVDDSDQLFVVVEEAKAPDLQRKVRLYRRPQPDAIHTYSPPVALFQPSDVCFYKLGGEEVLLVADEVNDAIHVVSVQNGCLNLLRYLAPGCPLLVQPTALNTDDKGRLWVACRGGRILTCTPLT